MENASKALIIAGAILISILLIAVSMYIYNSSQESITQAGQTMDAQAKNQYNAPITQYESANATSSDVKAVVQAVIDSNNANIDQAGKFIAIEQDLDTGLGTKGTIGTAGNPNNNSTAVDDAVTSMSSLKSKVNTGKKYTIHCHYTAGIVTKVEIKTN